MKKLTQNEINILLLVSKGYNNKKIASELFISYHTVKSHIAKIMKQLNAADRTNAVYIAVKHKII